MAVTAAGRGESSAAKGAQVVELEKVEGETRVAGARLVAPEEEPVE